MSEFCKHCGKRILRHNFALGPGYTHDDGSFNGYTYCHITAAEPEPQSADSRTENER